MASTPPTTSNEANRLSGGSAPHPPIGQPQAEIDTSPSQPDAPSLADTAPSAPEPVAAAPANQPSAPSGEASGEPAGVLPAPDPNPASAGGSSSTAVGQDAIDRVNEQYPSLAWMLTVAELEPLIRKWAQEGAPPERIQAELQSTEWWKTQSDAARAWYHLQVTDPGEAQKRIEAEKTALQASVGQKFGVAFSDKLLNSVAQAALMNGWTTQQAADHLSQAVTSDENGKLVVRPYFIDPRNGQRTDVATGNAGDFGGGLDRGGIQQGGGTYDAIVARLRAHAASYLLPKSDQELGREALDVISGHADENGIIAQLQTAASHLWGPQVAAQIATGRTVAQIVDPYRQAAAQMLGMNPDSIDFMQPRWQQAIASPTEKGDHVMLTMPQWQEKLMQDPQYGYHTSKNANDRVGAFVNVLGATFGKSTGGSGWGAIAPGGM